MTEFYFDHSIGAVVTVCPAGKASAPERVSRDAADLWLRDHYQKPPKLPLDRRSEWQRASPELREASHELAVQMRKQRRKNRKRLLKNSAQ